MLVSADTLLIIVHIFHTYTGYFSDPNYSIEMERGFGEVFQYLKEYWIGLLLLYLAITKRSPVYFGWAILFGYLLIDDSFTVHERLGAKINTYLNFSPMLGLRAQDFGELSVTALFGSCFFALIGLTHYFSDSSARKASRRLFVLLLTLAFFGVVTDMIHIIFKPPAWSLILGIVEDGGEMVVMSVILWFVFCLPKQEILGTREMLC